MLKCILRHKIAPHIMWGALSINRSIISLYMERVVRDSLVSVDSLSIIYYPWMQHHHLVCRRLQLYHLQMYHQMY